MNHLPTASAIGQERRGIARLPSAVGYPSRPLRAGTNHAICSVAMIAWGLRMQTAPDKRAEVQRILRGLLEPTRVRAGCLACHVYEDVEDPDVLALVQEWESADDLERYLRSEDRRKLVAVMELASRERLYAAPQHPYTKALLSAAPIPDPAVERSRKRIRLTGEPPSPPAIVPVPPAPEVGFVVVPATPAPPPPAVRSVPPDENVEFPPAWPAFPSVEFVDCAAPPLPPAPTTTGSVAPREPAEK